MPALLFFPAPGRRDNGGLYVYLIAILVALVAFTLLVMVSDWWEIYWWDTPEEKEEFERLREEWKSDLDWDKERENDETRD